MPADVRSVVEDAMLARGPRARNRAPSAISEFPEPIPACPITPAARDRP